MCAWAGGSFTRANGVSEWQNDASSGIGIEPGRHDAQDNDLATGINQCINKDGSNSFTGNANFGGFRPSNIAAGTAAAPAICAGNDVDTGIYSPAANEFGISTNGLEKVRIDSGGNFGVSNGVDAIPEGVVYAGNKQFTVKGTNTYAQVNVFTRSSIGTYGSTLNLSYSRGTTAGSMALVSSGDNLGQINFNGATGTEMRLAAQIMAETESTPSATSMPGRIKFLTTPNGSLSPVERMRIDRDGRVGIGAAPTYTLDVQGPVNGDLIVRNYNSNNGASANTQILIGNDASATAATIRLNSSANTGLGGANSLNIYQGLNAPVSIFTNATLRHNISSTGIHTMSAYGAGTATFGAGGVISSTSDERLKIKDGKIQEPLEKLKKLEPGYWYWNDQVKEELGEQRELGFFAQNVAHAIGEEAAPMPEDGKRWGYYDRSVLAVAVETIKILNAKVEALEAQVEMLQTQVALG
jgi:hypothetical protein